MKTTDLSEKVPEIIGKVEAEWSFSEGRMNGGKRRVRQVIIEKTKTLLS